MSAKKILVCTVGGSDAPVVTAVRNDQWDHVLFVCTSDSIRMITGEVRDAERMGAPAATRPSIPVQAGIDPSVWSTLNVPADDPDGVYDKLSRHLAVLRQQYDGAEVVVDFTGGTKSMSAGAVLAVALGTGTALQVTTGQRSDLVRVVDGTQQAMSLRTDRIVIDRQIELLRETWRSFGYQEAANGFAKLVPQAKGSPDLEHRLKFWADLGRRFAAWDRFDRRQAASNIHQARRKMPAALLEYAMLAEQLLTDAERGASALILRDLLRNAERCAARGRYDDAVARCYRLWEWTAQWLLLADANIHTSDIDPKAVPSEIIDGLHPNKNGRYKIGSERAWRLYRMKKPGSEATAFWNHADGTGKTHEQRYEELGPVRNNSILAHGAQPISAKNSKTILDWTGGPFIEMVAAAATRLREPHAMPQLPTELPEPAELKSGSVRAGRG